MKLPEEENNQFAEERTPGEVEQTLQAREEAKRNEEVQSSASNQESGEEVVSEPQEPTEDSEQVDGQE